MKGWNFVYFPYEAFNLIFCEIKGSFEYFFPFINLFKFRHNCYSSVIASNAERMFRTGTMSILIFISLDKDL